MATFPWGSPATGTGPVRAAIRGFRDVPPCWCLTKTERDACRHQQTTVISPPPGHPAGTRREEMRHNPGHQIQGGGEDDLKDDLRRRRDNLNPATTITTTTNNHHYLSACQPALFLSIAIKSNCFWEIIFSFSNQMSAVMKDTIVISENPTSLVVVENRNGG